MLKKILIGCGTVLLLGVIVAGGLAWWGWRIMTGPMYEPGGSPFSAGFFTEVQTFRSGTPIPEPAAALVFGLGLGLVGVRIWDNHRA